MHNSQGKSIYDVFEGNADREQDIHVFAWKKNGNPARASIHVYNEEEKLYAFQLLQSCGLEHSSFVVLHGIRYDLVGHEEPFNITKPHDAAELYGHFDIEYCGSDKDEKPLVYIFTTTQDEWDTALQATKHLYEQGLLAPKSCIELNGTKVVFVENPEAVRTGAQWVLDVRESMYHQQNNL